MTTFDLSKLRPRLKDVVTFQPAQSQLISVAPGIWEILEDTAEEKKSQFNLTTIRAYLENPDNSLNERELLGLDYNVLFGSGGSEFYHLSEENLDELSDVLEGFGFSIHSVQYLNGRPVVHVESD